MDAPAPAGANVAFHEHDWPGASVNGGGAHVVLVTWNGMDKVPIAVTDTPTAVRLAIAKLCGVLVVPGNGFNIRERNHFRMTLLPQPAEIGEVFARIERCLSRIADRAAPARHVA